LTLRETGYRGSVTLIGEEAGLPYERPPLSKPVGTSVLRKEICAGERLAAAEVDYRPGETVSALAPHAKTVSLANGGVLSYDKLLLATGAAPRRLTCPGSEHVHVFRTFEDAKRLYGAVSGARRVAIIGAGLIGMELAAVLRARDAQVTVLEAADRTLGRAVPTVLAGRLHARHEEAGVTFVFGARVQRISKDGVELEDGRHISADLVVAAIGVVPNTSVAEHAGLAVDNGIVVDPHLRTSAPDIFAAGDCACLNSGDGRSFRSESWRNAQFHGAHAARAMTGVTHPYARASWFWSDQYELGLQVVGLPASDQTSVARQISVDAQIIFFLDQAERLVAAAGLGRGTAVARDIRLAEMLIDAGEQPNRQLLADPATNLKSLLKQSRAA